MESRSVSDTDRDRGSKWYVVKEMKRQRNRLPSVDYSVHYLYIYTIETSAQAAVCVLCISTIGINKNTKMMRKENQEYCTFIPLGLVQLCFNIIIFVS